jgi:asparagine synthase (glutamine-hydrolysing)
MTIFQQQDTALPAEARIQLLDFRMDLAEGILAKVDRAGMAAGVETVRRCWTWRWCAWPGACRST